MKNEQNPRGPGVEPGSAGADTSGRSSADSPTVAGPADRRPEDAQVDDIVGWLRWLWQLGMWLHPLDHPTLPACAGLHRPDRPCDGKRGKHPCTAWSRRATNNPKMLRAMFAAPRNIGLACKVSGVLVVDEDRRGAFAEYAESIGQTVPATFAVATASGTHYYWRPPDGLQLGNGVGALAGRGIDIRGGGRGNGGYVVAPGSLHETGVLYLPLDVAAPILPAPGWLVEALQAPAPRPPRPPTSRPPRMGGKPYKLLASLVQVVLEASAPSATAKGNRNERLFWAACQMSKHARRGLFDEAAGRAALLEAARRVGLSDGDAMSTLESAARNVGGSW